MDDLISRAAAIARIDKCVALSGIGLEPVMAVRDVKALISVLPTIDAIPVEWLRGKMVEADEYCDNGLCSDISWLIQTWQKEQEAQDG